MPAARQLGNEIIVCLGEPFRLFGCVFHGPRYLVAKFFPRKNPGLREWAPVRSRGVAGQPFDPCPLHPDGDHPAERAAL
jgi:hypothetical protein